MKKTIRTIVQFSLIAAFTLPLSVLAADKKTTRTFNVASSELIGKVRKLVAEDRAKGFAEYAKGARALAKEFPGDARPFIMMSEASGLVEDKKDATLLKEQAETGILAILANDKKNETANSALMRLADSAEPAQAKAYLKQVIENTAGRLAEAAKGKLKNMEALGNPVAIAFEAVDGRKVDVAKMKGKVVLIDFWATWCGPCVAELPNVKRAYDKLHSKGFEIVGISLDSKESALRRFVKKEEMPWPQYFDGKGWKNSISTAHGIRSIPAMWLVDKEGNLADLNARADLEGKVEELLAAPSPEAK